MRSHFHCLLTIAIAAVGCGGPADSTEAIHTSLIEAGSPEAVAVLAVVNDTEVTFAILDDDANLDRRAARNIVTHRDGPDGVADTSDDNLFDNLEELDAISYVGQKALQQLLSYAKANGYYESGGGSEPTEAQKQRAILAVANDTNVTFQILDDDVGLDRRAAQGIVDRRPIKTIAELDAVPYVGASALNRLLEYAIANGYLDSSNARMADAIFSPRPYESSHNVRVAGLIDGATSSVDIAMYSFSDERIFDALEAAVQRGVNVRFVFETANADRKKTPAEIEGSKSARLERMGINVRWVNKIMHHKFMIVDGPRDDAALAASATVVTGSGNWSYGAATRYDENTIFLQGYPEITLELQREFNLMWQHSRDFIYDTTLPYELSSFEITDADITDDPATGAYLTSDNFSVSGDTFRIVTGRNTVSDALVGAIENATDSIWIASGHLRSRPISEALIAKAAANPSMDIRVYLDGQEYISDWYHQEQVSERADCLADATTPSQIRKCNDKGFHFGFEVGQSVDVRYKYYSYRWHYSYAVQMHHKLMIVDGDEVWTGSYNYSDNAEHNTFENMLVFRGPEFAGLVASFEANFAAIWGTHRDGTYADLIDEVETDAVIPLVFTPMALDWNEITQLKDTIRTNCADINTEPFRTEPEHHLVCYR